MSQHNTSLSNPLESKDGSFAGDNSLDEDGEDAPNYRNGATRRLPTVNERLGYLRPSRELLEYYRKKIAEYDDEHEALASKLELYKSTYEEQVSRQIE